MAAKHDLADLEVEDQDAIALLTADHLRVKRLFADFDAMKEDGSDEHKAAVVAQICQELIVHTTLEEEIFYPAVRKAIADDDLMDEAVVEHAGAKYLIAQLDAADPDDDLYDAKVTVLGEQIEHHVTEEEGSLFPQAIGSGVDTVALGSEMRTRKSELLADPTSPPSSAVKASAEADDGDYNDGGRETRSAKRKKPAVKRVARPAPKKKTSKKRH